MIIIMNSAEILKENLSILHIHMHTSGLCLDSPDVSLDYMVWTLGVAAHPLFSGWVCFLWSDGWNLLELTTLAYVYVYFHMQLSYFCRDSVDFLRVLGL